MGGFGPALGHEGMPQLCAGLRPRTETDRRSPEAGGELQSSGGEVGEPGPDAVGGDLRSADAARSGDLRRTLGLGVMGTNAPGPRPLTPDPSPRSTGARGEYLLPVALAREMSIEETNY